MDANGNDLDADLQRFKINAEVLQAGIIKALQKAPGINNQDSLISVNG
ncbi:MAG: hypothetical protein ACM3PE_12080 [Deltaproteobacteria bacterium]